MASEATKRPTGDKVTPSKYPFGLHSKEMGD
jgi:hypothetical protein